MSALHSSELGREKKRQLQALLQAKMDETLAAVRHKPQLNALEEVYGSAQALRLAEQRRMCSGKPVHAILSWRLPKAADLCLLAIDETGLIISDDTRNFLIASSPNNEFDNDDKERVEAQAKKRRFFELELACTLKEGERKKERKRGWERECVCVCEREGEGEPEQCVAHFLFFSSLFPSCLFFRFAFGANHMLPPALLLFLFFFLPSLLSLSLSTSPSFAYLLAWLGRHPAEGRT